MIKNRNNCIVHYNDNMLSIDARKGEDIIVYLPVRDKLNKNEIVDLRRYQIETFAESAYRERFPNVQCDAVMAEDECTNNIVKFTMSGEDTIKYIFEHRAYFDIFGVDKVTGVRIVLLNGLVNFRN